MFQLLHRSAQRRGAIADVEFEGESYGAGVSFLLGNVPPGRGPPLHRHPYAEVCIVRAGRLAATVGGEEVVAEAGDILVIGPGTPHRFAGIGEERVELMCIHATGRFDIEWLGARGDRVLGGPPEVPPGRSEATAPVDRRRREDSLAAGGGVGPAPVT